MTSDADALVALSRLLTEPVSVREALAHALRIGTRLAPVLQNARIYVFASAAGEALIFDGTGHISSHADMPSHLPAPVVDLSSGKTHAAKHSHGKLYLPLTSARNTRLGVLEFATRQGTMDEQNPLVTVVASHLSALLIRWQQEREIEELTLAVAQESKARDEFISLTAHELRSPLTSVKGYAQLLERLARKTPLPDAMIRSVEAIEMQSMRISEMIGELLDASRARRDRLEVTLAPVELSGIVIKVIERRNAYHLAHVITVNVPPETLTANVDAARVEQILRDLIDNAMRYSPEGGAVEVSLWKEDGSATISVRDEGSGVATDEVDHIFEYLYSAPRMRERNISGLGLGLYVSRELAERMGGKLVLHETRTQPPTGSEFRLILPLSDE